MYFRIDAVGRLFVTVVSLIWLMSALSAFVYMRHEGKEKRYFGFYLINVPPAAKVRVSL